MFAYIKVGLQCCCSADRGSGIACKPEQTTLSPRCMYIYTKNVYQNTHYGHLSVALLWAYFEIYQISIGQNKARKTLFVNMSPLFYAVGGSGIY